MAFPFGGGSRGGKPIARAAQVVGGSAGTVATVLRTLDPTSTLSLLSGSNGNLSLNTTTGTITAASAIASGACQTAVVREALGLLAIEYPLVVTGVAPMPQYAFAPVSTPSDAAPTFVSGTTQEA